MNSFEISTLKLGTLHETRLQDKVVRNMVNDSKARPLPANEYVPQNKLLIFGISAWQQRLKFFFAGQSESSRRKSAEYFKKTYLPRYDVDSRDLKSNLNCFASSLKFDNRHSTIQRLSKFIRISEYLANVKSQSANDTAQDFLSSARKQDKNL
jgi:hypothetical protein